MFPGSKGHLIKAYLYASQMSLILSAEAKVTKDKVNSGYLILDGPESRTLKLNQQIAPHSFSVWGKVQNFK